VFRRYTRPGCGRGWRRCPTALSTLEAAAAVALPDGEGRKLIDAKTIEEALQRRALLYDKPATSTMKW